MPVVIVGRRDISPSTARKRPEETETRDDLRQGAAGLRSQEIPQTDKGKSGTRCDGDEEHKHRSLRVSIANRGRHGGEPLVGVSVVLVLDDLLVVKGHAHDQGEQKGS